MKVTTLISNFTGGELSPRLDGRPDVAKYKNGCRAIENFITQVHGGARKREGTRFVVQLKTSTDPLVILPFQYSIDQSYALLVGPGYVWFAKDRGIITETAQTITGATATWPCVLTVPAHGYANGDTVVVLDVTGMEELNNRTFTVANATTDTFELSGVNGTGYMPFTAGGTVAKVVELTIPYTASEIEALEWTQSADVLYIVHKAHPLRRINRYSHTSWTLTEPEITTGPFRPINSDRDLILTVSAFSASATAYGTYVVGDTFTLTASSDVFDVGMVGALFRLNEEGGTTGLANPPLGDTNRFPTNGASYTYAGKVYGISGADGGSWGAYTRVPDHDSGAVKLLGDNSHYFTANFLHPTYCIVRVTAYASPTEVTAEIVRYHMPASIVSTGTSYWEEGSWSTYRGYPSAITFYEQRLMLGGSDSEPSVIWGSKTGVYTDFSDGPEDSDALSYRMASGSADVIRWLFGMRVLVAGTSQGEYAIAASSQNEALKPSNVKAVLQTTYGTSDVKPVRMNQVILYPQRDGAPGNGARKLREYSYSFQADSFVSVDLTVFSEHILSAGISRIAYQNAPDSTAWVVRADGVLVGLTYERNQETVAWHRHPMTNGAVETVATIPGASGDEIWLRVNRTIGGGAVSYVEVIPFDYRDDRALEDSVFADCTVSYDGEATTTVSGLWHLRGEALAILADGVVLSGQVDAFGRLTLPIAARKVHAGLRIASVLETEDLEAGAQAGTAQSRFKRISNLFLRLLNSRGGMVSMGRPDDTSTAIVYSRQTVDDFDDYVPLQSGLVEVDSTGGWERFARIRIEHDDPLPFHVTGIVAEMNTSG